MKYKDKTKEQLINELAELHQPIKELRARETGRRQADEALKRSETRYRRLFETAQGGILLLDADTGQILDFCLSHVLDVFGDGSTTEEGTMTEIAEAMTGIDMTTAETLTIIVKAMPNRDPMSECKEGGWARRYL